ICPTINPLRRPRCVLLPSLLRGGSQPIESIGVASLPKMGKVCKILLKSWRIFRGQRRVVNSPQFATYSPQLHHKNTSTKHCTFQKPPSKTRANPHVSLARPCSEFFPKN